MHKSLRRSIVGSFMVQVPALAFGFIAGACLTRLLGEEGRGAYTMLQASGVLVAFVLAFNLPLSTVYFVSKGGHAPRRVIGAAVIALGFIGGIAFLLAVLANMGLLPTRGLIPANGDRSTYLCFIAAFATMSVAHNVLNAAALGARQYKWANGITLFNAILSLVLFGGLFLTVDHRGIQGISTVLVLFLAIQFALLLAWTARMISDPGARPDFSGLRPLAKPMLAFSATGFAAGLLNQLNYRLDLLLLGEISGMGELGLYAVAVGVTQFFFVVPESVERIMQPQLLQLNDADALGPFRLYARLSTSIVIMGSLFAAVLAPLVLPLIYGQAFSGSVQAFWVLLPGTVFACVSKMLVLMVVRSGGIRYNVVAAGAGLIVTVALDLLLIPSFGRVGAAIASSAAYFTVMLVVLLVLVRRIGLPMANYFILTRADIRQLLARS